MQSRQEIGDGYLVARAREGYLDAYEMLVQRHSAMAYRVAHTGKEAGGMEVTGPVNEAPAGGHAATNLLDAVTLPCGSEIDALLEQVADGRASDRDAH